VRSLISGLSIPMRKRLMDAGLFGHLRYTPFIVLGRSRVGSNLLRSLLNAHPEIMAFGEVFRDTTNPDWDHVGYFQAASSRALLQRDPVRFLQIRLLGRYPRAVRAVGFKIFYYHAGGGRSGIWDWLRHQPAIKVIHLKRENLLQTHVSRKRAALTGQWVSTSGRPDETVSMHVDFDEALADFEQTRAWEEEFDRFFIGHDVLQVTYESLSTDIRSMTRRLEDFLQVSPQPLVPSTSRQAPYPLSAAVSNYVELKERFSGTPWERFFVNEEV